MSDAFDVFMLDGRRARNILKRQDSNVLKGHDFQSCRTRVHQDIARTKWASGTANCRAGTAGAEAQPTMAFNAGPEGQLHPKSQST